MVAVNKPKEQPPKQHSPTKTRADQQAPMMQRLQQSVRQQIKNTSVALQSDLTSQVYALQAQIQALQQVLTMLQTQVTLLTVSMSRTTPTTNAINPTTMDEMELDQPKTSPHE